MPYEYGKDDIKKGNAMLITQVIDALDERKKKANTIIVKQETEMDQIVNMIEKGSKIIQIPIVQAIISKKLGINLNEMTPQEETKLADDVAGVEASITKAMEKKKVEK